MDNVTLAVLGVPTLILVAFVLTFWQFTRKANGSGSHRTQIRCTDCERTYNTVNVLPLKRGGVSTVVCFCGNVLDIKPRKLLGRRWAHVSPHAGGKVDPYE